MEKYLLRGQPAVSELSEKNLSKTEKFKQLIKKLKAIL